MTLGSLRDTLRAFTISPFSAGPLDLSQRAQEKSYSTSRDKNGHGETQGYLQNLQAAQGNTGRNFMIFWPNGRVYQGLSGYQMVPHHAQW
jgi:hypothetical protein